MSYFDECTPDIVVKSLFSKYDKDASGSLTPGEMREFLEVDLGFTSEEAEVCTLLGDKDGDRRISFEEFKDWIRDKTTLKTISDKSRFYRLSKAVEMFKEYDKDNSGALERADVKELIVHVARGGKVENLDASLKALDKSGDGKVSFPEFLAWLNWCPME